MSYLIDLTGNQYGTLTVLSRAENGSHGCARWLVSCKCGKEKVVAGYDLRSGHTRSCGGSDCLPRLLSRGEGDFRRFLRSTRDAAKRREYIWSITDEQFRELIIQACYYCGVAPRQRTAKSRNYGIFSYNGIDRVNNKKGYTIDNVVPCCKQCNRSKSNMSQIDFSQWISSLYENFIRRNN